MPREIGRSFKPSVSSFKRSRGWRFQLLGPPSPVLRLRNGGVVLLGTARDDGSFTTFVRFTQRDLAPVKIR